MLVMNRKSKNYDISAAFAISFVLLHFKNIIVEGSAFLYQNISTLNILIAAISLILYARLLINHHVIVINQKAIAVWLFVLTSWLISIVLFPKYFVYASVKNELSEFIIYSVPALLFLPALTDCDELLHWLYKLRWLLFFGACYAVISMTISGRVQSGGNRYVEYSMSYGRAMILPTLLFISKWFKDKEFKDLLCSILCVIFVIAYASRFPLLCIAFYIAWKYLKDSLNPKKLFLVASALLGMFIIYIFQDTIINLLAQLFSRFGITSRNLILLLNGNIGYDSGREGIWQDLIQSLKSSPVFGFGAGGPNYMLNGGASHSYIFDTLGTYGYLGGILFMLTTNLIIIKKYRRTINPCKKEIMDIAFAGFYPICIFQMSLWRAYFFWILIAICCMNNIEFACEE